ncbi:hypothetical protein HOB10_04295 [Candidatus Parcubacteria bacterium]|jgi:hypothetical protein|nr:hypothetical protein [Candidatus Parcubacteria bacterium]
MNGSLKKTTVIISLLSLIFPSLSQAAETNYNYVISDQEFNDHTSMDKKEIQSFLSDQGGYLATYSKSGNNPSPAQLALNPDKKYPQTRTAAEIIYNSAQETKINPQFLLTMLQKEMSLITLTDPEPNRLKYAMGYACPDRGGCDWSKSGFGMQVRASAQQFRWDVDHINELSWRPGKQACAEDPNPYLPCTSRGVIVTPENAITAAMYRYTPHIAGNMQFKNIWGEFGFGGVIIDPEILSGIFPHGSLIKAKDGDDLESVYLIVNGKKRLFESEGALVSRFDPNKVLLVASEELLKYDDGAPIQHINFSVLQTPNGDKYLIDGLQKRLITSDEAFRQLGFNPAEIVEVSDDELDSLDDGADLEEGNASPLQEIMQDMTIGSIYYVKDGNKWSVIDMDILELNHPGVAPKEVTTKTLEQFEYMGALKLTDGTLIKKDLDKDVYVVSAGERRLIPDGNTFETLGYQWGNVVTVSKKVMNFHKLGTQLESL